MGENTTNTFPDRKDAELFQATITVMDDYGLHARPAATLAKAAQAFQASIRLSSASQSADAKSILDILSLAAGRNAKLTLECRGKDAGQAGEALLRLFQGCLKPEGVN